MATATQLVFSVMRINFSGYLCMCLAHSRFSIAILLPMSVTLPCLLSRFLVSCLFFAPASFCSLFGLSNLHIFDIKRLMAALLKLLRTLSHCSVANIVLQRGHDVSSSTRNHNRVWRSEVRVIKHLRHHSSDDLREVTLVDTLTSFVGKYRAGFSSFSLWCTNQNTTALLADSTTEEASTCILSTAQRSPPFLSKTPT